MDTMDVITFIDLVPDSVAPDSEPRYLLPAPRRAPCLTHEAWPKTGIGSAYAFERRLRRLTFRADPVARASEEALPPGQRKRLRTSIVGLASSGSRPMAPTRFASSLDVKPDMPTIASLGKRCY